MEPELIETPWIEPVRVWRACSARAGRVFLDSGGEVTARSRWAVLAFDPLDTLRLRVGPWPQTCGGFGGEVAGFGAPAGGPEAAVDPFSRLESLHGRWKALLARSSESDGRRPGPEHDAAEGDAPPFTGGVIGALGYDLGRALERLPSVALDDPILPDLWAGVYDGAILFDRARHRVWVSSWLNGGSHGRDARQKVLQTARGPDGDAPRARRAPERALEIGSQERERFLAGVSRIRSEIERGEIYQANLTRRVVCPVSEAAAGGVYEHLRAASPTPFGAYLHAGEFQLLSASPERFVRVEGRLVETRPIKGTRPRGSTHADDRRLRAQLLSSKKDLAELLMIVDLERNDLGRVCETGSISVVDFPVLEAYRSVWHLVADVRGRLAAGASPADVLRAMFPGGSISGAPKIRAMELLEEIETHRRKFAMGSLVAWDFDGRLDSSILIRTIVVRDGEAIYHVGGGIVADSAPAEEYDETVAKAAPLVAALGAA